MTWNVINLDDIDVGEHIKLTLSDDSEREGLYCGITLFEKKWFVDLNPISKPTMMSIPMASVVKFYKKMSKGN